MDDGQRASAPAIQERQRHRWAPQLTGHLAGAAGAGGDRRAAEKSMQGDHCCSVLC